MAKEKEEKNKKEVKWDVRLAIINETQPPQKVISNNETDETLDVHEAIARLLNDNEEIKKGILG